MINIVLPMLNLARIDSHSNDDYPAPLAEIGGVPLIQMVVENLKEVNDETNLTAVLHNSDCVSFKLDKTIDILSDGQANFVKLKEKTSGALCTVLMAVNYFYDDSPLIIANSDQLFDAGVLRDSIDYFMNNSADAGCVVFESVHPRWSFVTINNGLIVEASEKTPISRDAIAGFYFFRSGRQFFDYALKTILNGRSTDDIFYTSSVLNEYILDLKRVVPFRSENQHYHSLYSRKRLEGYESRQWARHQVAQS